ncbi:MAG: sodium:solute symporter family protein [Bacteroidetes bacterium]|nr:sodium:solute symporter family protein [Bacteroidota bacterium]
METSFYYWLAFITYSIIVIGIGFYIWAKRRKENIQEETESFWSAGKSLSGWSSGLSISASMMSISWSCVYGVQLFYWYGIGAAWLLIIPWLITMGGFFLLTPLFRKLKAFSQPELLAKKFGTKIRSLISIPLIFVFIVWGGAEIYAAGITIAPFLNISVQLTMFLLSLVIAIYTYTGGFQAVVSTDKIQFVLVALFITILAVIGYSAVSSSNNSFNLIEISLSAPKLENNFSAFLAPGMAIIILTFIAYLPGWLVETDIWIRLQASKNNKEARKGIIIASVNSFIFVGIFPMIIGLTALILYPVVDGEIPAKLQDGALIFQNLMADFSPVWLNVLLGVGLIAAAMSTVDTCGNVVALSLSYDIVEPMLKNRITPKNKKQMASWISVFAIFLAFIFALFTESLWDIFYLSSAILTTTIFIPVISVFLPNTKKREVIFSVIFGFIGTLIFYFLESRGLLASIEPEFIASTQLGYILYGFIMSVLGFVIGKFIR